MTTTTVRCEKTGETFEAREIRWANTSWMPRCNAPISDAEARMSSSDTKRPDGLPWGARIVAGRILWFPIDPSSLP